MFNYIKKLIIISLTGFILTACSNTNVTKNSIQESSTILNNNEIQETNNEIKSTPQLMETSSPSITIKPKNNLEYCKKHLIVMWDDYVWTNDDGHTGYNFWTDNSKYLKNFIDCGWNIDAPDKYGKYPLVQAFEVFNKSPEQLRNFLQYKPNLSIKDSKGHDMYMVALAIENLPQDVLQKLKDITPKEQQEKDKKIVKMTIHGSKLSIADLEIYLASGIDINEDLTAYTYIGEQTAPDLETGTILGSAIKNNDISKIKWLLEHEANANQHFGVGEFERSPLHYTLSSGSDISISELLLQHKADPNEKVMLNPGSATLYAANACNSKITELLKRYNGTKWYYEGESDKGMEIFSKEQILSSCENTP